MGRARNILRRTWEKLEESESLMEAEEAVGEVEAVQRIQKLQRCVRPLEVLMGQLLRELKSSRGLRYLGYRRLKEFVREELKMSERGGRDLMFLEKAFREEPKLGRAYAEGVVSVGEVRLISGVEGRKEEHIKRAARTTCRQFRREMVFLRKLKEFEPELWMRFGGPLPQEGLEESFAGASEGGEERQTFAHTSGGASGGSVPLNGGVPSNAGVLSTEGRAPHPPPVVSRLPRWVTTIRFWAPQEPPPAVETHRRSVRDGDRLRRATHPGLRAVGVPPRRTSTPTPFPGAAT